MAKLTLYTSIYHHHKVRATECMFRAFWEELERQGAESPFLPSDPTGMFRLTEHDFFSLGPREPLAGRVALNLSRRRLLKRALILERTTVAKESRLKFVELAFELKDPAAQQRLRTKIYDALPPAARTNQSDLWVDIPQSPDVDEEARDCPIVLEGDQVESLSDLMPTDDWARSYAVNKLRGHVFYVGDLEKRQTVAAVAERVLLNEYGIRLESSARSALK